MTATARTYPLALCSHCRQRRVCRPRGLCAVCYRSPLRHSYSTGRGARTPGQQCARSDASDLFDSHQHLALSVAKGLRSRYRRCTLAELHNAALLGVWQAALKWDEGVAFYVAARRRARLAIWEYAIGWSRRRGRRQAAILRPLQREPACQDQRAREIIEAHDCCAVALSRLPPRRAAILRRRFLESGTLEEIAQEQGVSVTAVGHQIATALKRARNWCSGCA